MKTKIIYTLMIIIMSLLLLTSCNNWLDIMPKERVDRDELYSSEKGFKNSLIGCYIKLRNVYIPNLTMTNIEYMAQNWRVNTSLDNSIEENLTKFNYEDNSVKNFVDDLFEDMFNVIAQVNDIIAHTETNANIFNDNNLKDLIRGEALAIRAFCHFDILRLFGQLPVNAIKNIDLPYKKEASVTNATYYNYNDYINIIIADYKEALVLLGQSDLSMSDYSYSELDKPSSMINSGKIKDDFYAYRKVRFNYWGVKSLLARAYLYFGDKDSAYNTAMEVINATVTGNNSTNKGVKIINFNGANDIASNKYTLPSETLIAFNATNMAEKVDPLFLNAGFLYVFDKKDDLQLSLFEKYTSLNSNQSDVNNKYITTHNRFQLWYMNDANTFSSKLTTKKYHNAHLNIKEKVVPIIRLSEVYLIAIEACLDIAKANQLMGYYMSDRGITISNMDKDELDKEILDEYHREFFAEGQMWFAYKRRGSSSMRWGSNSVVEDNYIIPLPKTEYK